MSPRNTPLTKRQILDGEALQDVELQPLKSNSDVGNHDGSHDLAVATSMDRQDKKVDVDGDEPGDDKGASEKPGRSVSAMINQPTTACLMYSFCSVSMVLTNKSLASSYNHLIDGDLNLLLVVFQAIVAVVAVEGCKKMKWVEYPPITWQLVKQWAPVNIFFCLMLFTGMASLEHNSVPIVTIFKNVTNIVTFCGDYIFFEAKVETLVILAFAVMLSGAVAAAWHDMSVSWAGVMWMACNCLSTSAYVLYMKFATKHVKIPKFGMVFLNNLLCIGFLLPAATLRGETSIFFRTTDLHTLDYTSKNLFAGLIGFFLNFASLNCVAATGPTTYAIVGAMNKIPVAFLGYILFDNVISQETWAFIAVSMTGGFLYSYAKISSKK
mmetsp:Transcript_19251/g.54601  ORF Transcript_19251/g.54601 Transcript_19251/m.54601 type:complete len:381 (+) Transcript_19251:283-1425(+)|eukprot:CAMPEP_0119559890 /NCGR_PEP_ID=MMETSP1352-20130426/13541_1 /TAXON_ID=265584 /ORGANISM="Stauroneis constricta, Strain CCMP1120" /LENGTH=380 /DNA_ID=CAMNT_0007607709 /DNA_START=204 /DNA_END=1346 /DNA_ORIENTATION=-